MSALTTPQGSSGQTQTGQSQTTTSSAQQSAPQGSSSGSGGKTWPAPKSVEVPKGSAGYTNESFGEPTGGQDRVILEGSAVVSRVDEDGNVFEALTDGPADNDVPIKVRQNEFEEAAKERYAHNTGGSSGSGSSSSGS